MANKKIDIALHPDAGGMYVSEAKVYPREISGRFNTLRTAAVVWLLGMYYVLPWISWDGRQSVLFDLPARKFHIFGLTFWPQDFIFLAMLLMISAFALFFFTALAGRLWCGYACPQTVWTETFLWIEQWTEGDRNRRMKLDQLPWSNPERLRRSGSKHLLWVVFALWTGFTFVGFFSPIRDLASRLLPFQWGGWEIFWVLFYSLATWGNAGFLREQVCKYMCPYARFQSAMFDRNTLLIAYDPMRGEPRGPRRRDLLDTVLERARGLLPKETAEEYVVRAALNPSAADARAQAHSSVTYDRAANLEPLPKFEPEQLGDCIDCTLCVQVGPTGIDIRNGLQYECIACGACIDACDSVMEKMGYPQGLIRYDTQNGIDGKPTRILRPRIFVYGALLAALIIGWAWGVSSRSPLIVEVLRDRNALYRETAQGVENSYSLKLVNKTDTEAHYRILLETAPAGASLSRIPAEIVLEPQKVLTLPVTVTAPDGTRGRTPLTFLVESIDGQVKTSVDSSFFGRI